jgi:hypothetical protein
MMTDPTVRGYMVISPLTHLREAYGAEDRAAIEARIPDPIRRALEDVVDVAWYPRAYTVAIQRAIAEHHRDTDGRVREALFELGHATAARALDTFLKLVIKVMTPEVFARKVPDVWARDHKGGTLTTDTSDVANNHVVFRLVDVAGYDYIGAALPGFHTATLTALGCKDLRFESDWTAENPGPATVTCEFYWK